MISCACCVVGAGPAGAMLALLLARQGVQVTLLEARHNFDRDFRGNTLNPAALEVLSSLGLLEQLLRLPHARITSFSVETADGPVRFADFSRLATRHPYVLMLPQSLFLDFLTAEAQRYPNFRLLMGANVQSLLVEGQSVVGVRFRAEDGSDEVRAQVTVGADGRFSRVRRLAGFKQIGAASPIDVLWFRLPRRPGDPGEAGAHFRFGPNALLVVMDHVDEWQIGYIIAKGSYQQLRASGLEALRQSIARLAPELADRVEHLRDWNQGSLLSIESSRVERWYRDGLLLIGDAAHVMSPVGGVGINCAIQDAVVAARVLAEPLQAGRVRPEQLREVQRQRDLATRIVQACQDFAQRQVVDRALATDAPFRIPPLLRLCLHLPLLRDVPTRLIAYGAWRT